MALVGRWTLDGQAFDSSGQGNNGTVTGALYTNGKGSPGLCLVERHLWLVFTPLLV